MRKIARVDDNQKIIVAEFRSLGCSVLHLHQIGSGCPDILVGIEGQNILVEIKDSSKPPWAQKLTEDEKKFKDNWKGNYHIVRSVESARAIVKYYLKSDGRTPFNNAGTPLSQCS